MSSMNVPLVVAPNWFMRIAMSAMATMPTAGARVAGRR
jgi:hypothetical protein